MSDDGSQVAQPYIKYELCNPGAAEGEREFVRWDDPQGRFVSFIDDLESHVNVGTDFRFQVGGRKCTVVMDKDLPFIVAAPVDMHGKQMLSFESNNWETADPVGLSVRALGTANDLLDVIQDGGPIVVPILPSAGDAENGLSHAEHPYYQQLAKESITDERYDLKVANCIEKARGILKKDFDIQCADRMFINGYSSSGGFAQRFCLIHPEMVERACIGGASCSIPVISEKEGKAMPYPAGISDFQELFGKSFNRDAYKDIDFDYYVGELEYEPLSSRGRHSDGSMPRMHDVYDCFDRSCPDQVAEVVKKEYGSDPWERINGTNEKLGLLGQAEFDGVKIHHEVYPDKTHNKQGLAYLITYQPDKYKCKDAQGNLCKVFVSENGTCMCDNGMETKPFLCSNYRVYEMRDGIECPVQHMGEPETIINDDGERVRGLSPMQHEIRASYAKAKAAVLGQETQRDVFRGYGDPSISIEYENNGMEIV